ncbi:hypothetical protein Lesp02_12720 [Lentzea sp. NBRC 105346]|uniref:CGNR zinc finger domain-containing protein n=1 Tax=Lentzea sp. NBRC 105346 TaxID=3032205 RepID=UPI0024A24F70|nr:CGNR zinc finger domain-containing protein [Lentzea sp. NBRC 105346]GLZ29082.1 hypothetical protein Lesp02_12720 [Lentzea sp. NBRC 105346]
MLEPSPEAELVMAFANTVDLEDGTDELATSAEANKWLQANDLPRVNAADHRRLLDLRTGIRAALAGSTETGTGQAVLAELPVFVNLTGDVLTATHSALSRLAIAWAVVALTGQAERLKRCADDACGWVFWDVSRNHSRRWCTMRVCGNRAKARRYTARQKQER